MSSQYAAELLQATPRFYLAVVDLGVAWGRNKAGDTRGAQCKLAGG